MLHLLLAILLHLLCISFLKAEPLVTFSQGTLNGTIRESRSGRRYAAFLGIPYGQAPIGNLRFKNPVPVDNWNGIRQADRYGNACPQFNRSGKLIGNEDCLYINVYTPLLKFNSCWTNKETKKSLLPVMVFIHGGGFSRGSNQCCRENYLLDRDIILVLMNYRVGIFGFLSTGDASAPGNFGLKDQVLALKWVQRNIKAFGGNPNKVTLFGQSAGGMSTGLHALSKASNGLFHQYIIQSGSPLNDWSYKKRSNVIQHAKKLAPLVSCAFNTSESFIACLRTKSVDSLMNTKSIFGEFGAFTNIFWTPTDEPDVEGAFLIDSPRNLINQNLMKDLPFISGCVTDEGLAGTMKLYVNSKAYSFAVSKLDQLIPFVAGSALLGSKNKEKFSKAAKKFYFNNTIDVFNKDKFIGNITNYMSDAQFLYPELRMMEKVASKFKSSIYFYLFGYGGTVVNNKNLGVGHAAEIKYIFKEGSLTAKEKSVSELMIDLWTSFAANGKPISKQLKSDDFWMPYNPENTVHLQIGSINNNTSEPSVSLLNNYFTKRMNFWKENSLI